MGTFCELARRLNEAARQAGLAEDVGRLTPYEAQERIELRLRERQRALEDMDLLAYLIARYVMLAVHAPQRFPRRPNAVRAEMSDKEMLENLRRAGQ